MNTGIEINFRDYLEAKVTVDDMSLHKETFTRFLSKISRLDSPCILDVGTGTGAMIRRMIEADWKDNPVIYGIDTDAKNLVLAKKRCRKLLADKDMHIEEREGGINGYRGKANITVRLLQGDLFDTKVQSNLKDILFNCITAHAFMDLVPLEQTLDIISLLIDEGGIFYSTTNYDGTTTLLPSYED